MMSTIFRRNFRSLSSRLLGNFTVPVPAMGEAVKEGQVVEWLKQPGDAVAMDEVFCVLETDKVTVDIRAPQAGTLLKHLANVDDTVKTDQVIAEFSDEVAAGAAAASKPAAAAPTPAATPAPATPTPAAPVATPTEHIAAARIPSIRFRHGRLNQMNNIAPTAGTAKVQSIEILEFASNFGRLPEFSEDEMLRVSLGGLDP